MESVRVSGVTPDMSGGGVDGTPSVNLKDDKGFKVGPLLFSGVASTGAAILNEAVEVDALGVDEPKVSLPRVDGLVAIPRGVGVWQQE